MVLIIVFRAAKKPIRQPKRKIFSAIQKPAAKAPIAVKLVVSNRLLQSIAKSDFYSLIRQMLTDLSPMDHQRYGLP